MEGEESGGDWWRCGHGREKDSCMFASRGMGKIEYSFISLRALSLLFFKKDEF